MQASDDSVARAAVEKATSNEIALTAKLAVRAFERLYFPCDEVDNLCDVILLSAKLFAVTQVSGAKAGVAAAPRGSARQT